MMNIQKNMSSLYASLNIFQKKTLRFSLIFWSTIAIFICAQVSTLAQGNLSNEQLNQLSKPAVVRVFDGCKGVFRYAAPSGEKSLSSTFEREVISVGTGSGFLINPNGYIATNAHVVSDTHDKYNLCRENLFKDFVRQIEATLEYDKGFLSEDPESLEFFRNNSKLLEETFEGLNKVSLPNGRMLNFSIEDFGDPIGSEDAQVKGKDVAIIKVELQKAPTLSLSNTGLPQIGSKVLVMGYPSDADSDIFNFDSVVQMSSISANVSSIKETTDGVKVIQISGGVSQGISGGPVIDTEGKVLGLVAFGSLNSSGSTNISSSIPTSTLKEFIGNEGAQSGDVDRIYRTGLDFFWAGEYRRAKLEFEKVQGLFEDHSEVDELIKDVNIEISSTSNVVTPETSSKLPIGWIILASILGLLVISAAGIALGKAYFQKSSSSTPGSSSTPVRSQSSAKVYSSQMPFPPQTPAPLQVSSPVRPNNSSATRVHIPPSKTALNNVSMNRAVNQPATVATSWLEIEYNGEIKRLYLSKEHHKLGRDTSWADLEIPNEWGVVSGRHAVLQKEGDSYRIFDGDGQGRTSSNGLEDPSGEPITAKTGYCLVHSAQLKIGSISGDKVTMTFFSPVSVKRAYDPTQVAR